jgi:RHS repeat-associated protein
MCLNGRGLGFAFTRSYSSKAPAKPDVYPLGQGWDHNYNLTLALTTDPDFPTQPAYVLSNGNNRLDTYRHPYLGGGNFGPSWYSYGVYSELKVSGTDVILRARHGTKTYFSFAGNSALGILTKIEDRNGNHLTFTYDGSGRLSTITEPMGRVVTLAYFGPGSGKERLINTVSDPTGRAVTFQYVQQDALDALSWVLVAATSPVAPTATDPIDPTFTYGWANGKTEGYLYTAYDGTTLSYNLTAVIAPREFIGIDTGTHLPTGTPYVQFGYGAGTDWRRDWCTSQTLGDPAGGSPTGGTITYSYTTTGLSTNPLNNPNDVRLKTTIMDRGGRHTEYLFNERGNVLVITEFTNEANLPAQISTEFEYFWYYQNWITGGAWGPDGELWKITRPNGTIEERSYLNLATTFAPRWSAGDLTDITITDPQSNQHHTGYTWDPVYNHPLTVTDENSHVTSFAYDYMEGTATGGSYPVEQLMADELWMPLADLQNILAHGFTGILKNADLNGDGQHAICRGNVVQKIYPDVSLTSQATGGATVQTWETDHIQQGIYSLTYNSHGQVTSQTDPEQNASVYTYTKETDLDGNGTSDGAPADFTGTDNLTGGFLKRVVSDVALPYSDPDGQLAGISTRNLTTDIGRDSTYNPAPKAAITDLVHNLRGNLTSFTDPRGVKTDYWVNELEEVWRVAEATAVTPTGRASGWNGADEATSSDFGVLTNIIRRWQYDANGMTITFQRRNAGNLTDTGTYPGWLEQSYTYDLLNRMKTRVIERGATGQTSTGTYTYDLGDDLLDEAQAPEGNRAKYTYTARGQVASVTEGWLSADAAETDYAYDADRNLITITVDPSPGLNRVTTNAYDGFDRLVTTTTPATSPMIPTVTTYTYDSAANVTKVEVQGSPSAAGGSATLTRSEYRYDERNRVYQIDQSDPQSAFTDGALTPGDGKVSTRIDLDRVGRRIGTLTDAGKAYRAYFDGLSNLAKTLDPMSNAVDNSFDDNGDLVKVKQTDQYPGGTTRSFETFNIYDALGRVVSTTDNAGDTHRFTFDSRDNVVAASDAQNPNNAAGQINGKTVNQPGNTRSYTHNGFDQVLQEQLDLRVGGNGAGAIDTSNSFNGDGHVIVQMAYDQNGRVTSRTDDNSKATSYLYDSRSRVTRQTFADATHQDYVYDKASNVTQVTDARGDVVTMSYDTADRLTNVQATLALGVVGTQRLAFEYDGLGRRTKSISSDDTTIGNTDDWAVTRNYDALSRIKVETQHSNDATNQRVETSSWAEESKRTSLLYQSGLTVGYTYDDLGRILTIRPAGGTLTTYSYAGYRLHERIYSNGTGEYHHDFGSHADTLYYDDAGRPIKSDYRTIPGALITGFENAFDRMGNRKYERRLHNASKGDNYVYDSLYRLTSFERLVPAANVGTPGLTGWTAKKDYKFDGVENWRQLITNNGTPQNNSVNNTEAYSTFGSVTPTYDAEGNMTSPGGTPATTFKYDFLNRLRQIVQGTKTVNHYYDAEGRRVKTTISNVNLAPPVIEYTYDGWEVIEERNSAGQLMRRWVNGREIDEPLQLENLSFWPNAGTYEFQRSTLGNVVAITNGSGTVLERYTYDAYGTPQFETPANAAKSVTASDYGNPYLFNGRRYDPWIYPMYEYRTRMYSPAMGRFVQRDSIGVWGDEAEVGSPYAFVASNTPNFADPLGQQTGLQGLMRGGAGIPQAMEAAKVAGGVIVGGALTGGAAVVAAATAAAPVVLIVAGVVIVISIPDNAGPHRQSQPTQPGGGSTATTAPPPAIPIPLPAPKGGGGGPVTGDPFGPEGPLGPLSPAANPMLWWYMIACETSMNVWIEVFAHHKNARPSTEEDHQNGEARKKRDRGGEKGDDSRREPRNPPKNHKGPWPPKPPPPPTPPPATPPPK